MIFCNLKDNKIKNLQFPIDVDEDELNSGELSPLDTIKIGLDESDYIVLEDDNGVIGKKTKIYDEYNNPLYEIVNKKPVLIKDNDRLPEIKIKIGAKLKGDYLNDIKWTDDAKMFYDKFKLANPEDETCDDWFSDVLVYWDEARTERELNKTAINDFELDSGTVLADIGAITYNPTHAKSKEDIEG